MKDKGKDGASMEEMKISQDMFEFDPSNGNDAEKIAKPSVTYLKDAIRRYRQNKVATVAMGILVLILIMSVVVPMLSPYDYSMQDYLNINAKPSSQYWRYICKMLGGSESFLDDSFCISIFKQHHRYNLRRNIRILWWMGRQHNDAYC